MDVRLHRWIGVALAMGLAGAATAGPLDPPIGPVMPTGKTIGLVEPRTALEPGDPATTLTVDQAGTYYLAGNLTVDGAAPAIEVTASNVTIDLNGFAVMASAKSSGVDGIMLLPGTGNVTIVNGTVSSFGARGIDASASDGLRLENVRLLDNGAEGVHGGTNATLVGCQIMDNGNIGANLPGGSVISRCLAANNGNDGFELSIYSTVSNSAARDNSGFGFQTLGNGAFAFDTCVAYSNGLCGWRTADGATLNGCTATQNNVHGFEILGNATLNGCTASDNGADGYNVTETTMNGCTAVDNNNDGFEMKDDSSCSECHAMTNNAEGFETQGTGNRLVGCYSRGNTNGFRIGGSVVLMENVAQSNSGMAYELEGDATGAIFPIVSDPANAGVRDNLETP